MKVVVIAGTSSGVGKTSLAVGIMKALRSRGLTVQPFKIGPDFLDPMHHEQATGRLSINLDGWMLDWEQNVASFHRAMEGADIAVVEGVMGLFDGRDGKTEVGSTAQMAKWLNAPVLLVLDCWALARSAAAMVKGYQGFDPDLKVSGVIFNKVGGKAHTQWLKEALLASGVDVQLLGGVPKDAKVAIQERHLGLHRPADSDFSDTRVEKLGALVEENLDMEALLSISKTADPPSPPSAPQPSISGSRPRIAVAKDDAFCFYYAENLQLLREAGAEIIFFSPLNDKFPEGVAGLYLGGGYPELYADQLAERTDMKETLKAFANAGAVVYAECGGLLYLSQSIQPLQNKPATMVGVFPFRTHMTADSMKMGYVEVETQQSCTLFRPEQTVRGHVYHFSEILQERVVGGFGSGGVLESGKGWVAGYKAELQVPGSQPLEEGFTKGNVLASYVHLHFGSNPQLAVDLVERCREVDADAVNAAIKQALADEQQSFQPKPYHHEGLPPLPRIKAAQSSPNLAALLDGRKSLARARSVDIFNHHQPKAPSTGAEPLDLGEVLRRSEAARSTSMDVSHVPGILSWPLLSSTPGECSPRSPDSSPTQTHVEHSMSSFSPSSSRDKNLNVSPLRTGSDCGYDVGRDGGPQASTSGQDDLLVQKLAQRVPSRLSLAPGVLSHQSSYNSCANPDAIVSLLPSGTEIVFALGLENRLIAVTDLCDYPAQAKAIPKACNSLVDCSSMSMQEVEEEMQQYKSKGLPPFKIDSNFLAQYQPGIVLTQNVCQTCDPSTRSVIQALADSGLLDSDPPAKVVEMNCRTIADILESILEVGNAARAQGEAVRVVERLRSRLRAVATSVSRAARRPRVLSLEGLAPLCLGGQWLPEMKELAGGECGLQQPGDSPKRITWEEVRRFEPEVLILSPCSCDPQRALLEATNLAGLPGWWSLPAVKTGQVYIVDHAFFSRPGPRILQGIEILARILHPDLWVQRAPENSVLKLALKGGQRCRQRLLHTYFLPYS